MKCCASPITSIAGDAPPTPSRTRTVAEDFGALLLAQALRPLAAPMGFFGEIAVEAMARGVMRSGRGGLAGEVLRAIEQSES